MVKAREDLVPAALSLLGVGNLRSGLPSLRMLKLRPGEGKELT